MSTADYLSSNPCTHNYADIQQKHRFNARYAAQYVIKFSQLPRDNINSNHHDCSRFLKCTENEICCWGQPLQRRQYQPELTFSLLRTIFTSANLCNHRSSRIFDIFRFCTFMEDVIEHRPQDSTGASRMSVLYFQD